MKLKPHWWCSKLFFCLSLTCFTRNSLCHLHVALFLWFPFIYLLPQIVFFVACGFYDFILLFVSKHGKYCVSLCWNVAHFCFFPPLSVFHFLWQRGEFAVSDIMTTSFAFLIKVKIFPWAYSGMGNRCECVSRRLCDLWKVCVHVKRYVYIHIYSCVC